MLIGMAVLPPYKRIGVGDTLDGRYALRSILGEGAYGTVFRAEHLYTKRTVAVKVLREDVLNSDDVIKRFLREAQLASELDHPNCVRTHEFSKAPNGQYYLVMECIEGETLGKRLDRVGRLTLQEAKLIMSQLLSALGAAHKKGIVHRDIKPDNIMLVKHDDGTEQVKLLDFGFAKKPATLSEALNNEEAITRVGFALGTPEYMAPEQAQSGEVDQRTDLYSAGVILYRMIVGKPPFFNDNPLETVLDQIKKAPPAPRTVAPEAMIPGSVEGLVLRALCKKPQERYPDAHSFSAALDAAFSHPTQPPFPALPPEAIAASAPPTTNAVAAFFAPIATREFWGQVSSGKWRERDYWQRLLVLAILPSLIVLAALWKLLSSSAPPPATPKPLPAAASQPKIPIVVAQTLPESEPASEPTSDSAPTTEPESAPVEPPASEALLEALAMMSAGEVKDAVKKLEAICKESPEDSEAWIALAEGYAFYERWDDAQRAINEAKKWDSSASPTKDTLNIAMRAFDENNKKTIKEVKGFVTSKHVAPLLAPRIGERLEKPKLRALAASTLAQIGKTKAYDPVPPLISTLQSLESCEAKIPIVNALSAFPKDQRALSALKEEAGTVRLRSKNRCMLKLLPETITKMEKK